MDKPIRRVERFGLCSDGVTVVTVHPQATRPLDVPGHVGTVVARLEEWVGEEDAIRVVAALNEAKLPAIEHRGTRLEGSRPVEVPVSRAVDRHNEELRKANEAERR